MFVATKLFHKAGEGSGGGSDPHNLGYYADLTALQTAHATGADGDFAILGSTDTIWVWDSGTSAWKDTDTKGQVESVNNKTGTVTLTATDVGALANTATGFSSLTIGGNAAYNGRSTNVGINSTASSGSGTAFGNSANCSGPYGVAIGASPVASKDYTIAIGNSARAEQIGSIQLGKGTNNETSTFCVGLVSDNIGTTANYKMLDADGTIPTDRYTTTPSADGTYVPTLTISSGTPTRSWAAPSGGLPSQTGNSGKFLTTDGTDASWSDKPLVNSASSPLSSYIIGGVQNLTGLYKVVIGYQAKTSQDDGIAIGHSCNSDGQYATSVGKSIINQGENGVAVGHMAQIDAYSSNTVAIGYSARCSSSGAIAIGQNTRASGAKSIQLGSTGNTTTNSDANTFKVANANGNYEMMSADGTIPTARLTKANTTVTLAVADWSSSTQTVSVTGVTATSIVFVAPDSASQSDYTSAGILCTAQGAGTLTFTCSTTPTNAITVNVVAL